MLTDQAQALRKLVMESSTTDISRSRCRARTVAVTSGKGGVGKTSVAVNLAIQLSRMGRRVVLLDADLGTANVDLLCDLAPTRNLAHVIAGRCGFEQAMITGPGGFQLVPGASGLAQMAALNDFERHRLIDQMHQLEQKVDLLLIDTGAGVSPNVLSFAVSVDQLLVITTPEPTAIADAYAVIKTVHRQRQEHDVRVLVNMVREAPEGRDVFDRIDAVCRRFLRLTLRYAGHVSVDTHVGESVRHRRPFVIGSPNCEASRCIRQLAHKMDRYTVEPDGGGLLRRMARWLAV